MSFGWENKVRFVEAVADYKHEIVRSSFREKRRELDIYVETRTGKALLYYCLVMQDREMLEKLLEGVKEFSLSGVTSYEVLGTPGGGYSRLVLDAPLWMFEMLIDHGMHWMVGSDNILSKLASHLDVPKLNLIFKKGYRGQGFTEREFWDHFQSSLPASCFTLRVTAKFASKTGTIWLRTKEQVPLITRLQTLVNLRGARMVPRLRKRGCFIQLMTPDLLRELGEFLAKTEDGPTYRGYFYGNPTQLYHSKASLLFV